MKKYLCSMGAWVALAAMTAGGQTSSSGGSQSTSGSTQGTTSSSQGAMSGSQGTSSSQGNLPPGLQNRNQLPPGLQNRDQLPPGLAQRTNSTSNFGATNQFGNTSQGAAAAGTNSSGLFPTGRSGETNRFLGTNSHSRGSSSYGTNSNPSERDSFGTNNRERNSRHQDEAVTASDQKLLVTVREKVQTEVRGLTATAAGAWAPVNFRIEQGVVTIIGVVQSIEIKQQIETCVRRVPGVVRVVDTIEIGSAQGGGGGDSDQMLVTRVRETVLPQIQVSGIDFQCHGGVVTVIGAVPQEEQKQRLVTLVRQVPGVVNVTDQVTVNAEIQGQTRLGQPEQTRLGQPEQTRGDQNEQGKAVNAAVETSKTNLSPTGSTNSLPPGLEKRDQLPPGLQNRQQPPPGLSKRTNDVTQPNP